jgi:hypothetical protein
MMTTDAVATLMDAQVDDDGQLNVGVESTDYGTLCYLMDAGLINQRGQLTDQGVVWFNTHVTD